VLAQTYPRLASFARNRGASVLEIMEAVDLDSLFLLPLSQQAFEELETLQAQLQDIPYDEDAVDRWIPVWGNTYTSRSFYSQVFKNMDTHPIFKIIWKSRCTPRVKFFAWLVLVDRLNTKTMLRRRLCVTVEKRRPLTIYSLNAHLQKNARRLYISTGTHHYLCWTGTPKLEASTTYLSSHKQL